MIDLSNYEMVKERLPRFWEKYPNGRIITVILRLSDDMSQIVMEAQLFRDAEDDKPFANGYAEERQGAGMTQKQCWIETCETSAIGRALANIGLSGGERPSREEMEKAQREPEPTPAFDLGAEKKKLFREMSDTFGDAQKAGDFIKGICASLLNKGTIDTEEELRQVRDRVAEQMLS